MGFLIQKKGLSGLYYHPLNTFEQWKTIDDKSNEYDAKQIVLELSEKEKGEYRVKDIYSGKILFAITTN